MKGSCKDGGPCCGGEAHCDCGVPPSDDVIPVSDQVKEGESQTRETAILLALEDCRTNCPDARSADACDGLDAMGVCPHILAHREDGA